MQSICNDLSSLPLSKSGLQQGLEWALSVSPCCRRRDVVVAAAASTAALAAVVARPPVLLSHGRPDPPGGSVSADAAAAVEVVAEVLAAVDAKVRRGQGTGEDGGTVAWGLKQGEEGVCVESRTVVEAC